MSAPTDDGVDDLRTDDDRSPDERPDPRRRNTIVLVAAAAALCVVGAGFALGSLTATDPDPTTATDGAPATPSAPAEPGGGDPAPAPAGPPPGGETASFSSPTGNIGCTLDSAGARCDLIERDWEPPPQPASCTQTWGQGVVLAPQGAGYVCSAASVLGASTVLEYGAVAQRGTVRCTSSEAGMRCEDTATGRGFDVSRSAVQLF